MPETHDLTCLTRIPDVAKACGWWLVDHTKSPQDYRKDLAYWTNGQSVITEATPADYARAIGECVQRLEAYGGVIDTGLVSVTVPDRGCWSWRKQGGPIKALVSALVACKKPTFEEAVIEGLTEFRDMAAEEAARRNKGVRDIRASYLRVRNAERPEGSSDA